MNATANTLLDIAQLSQLEQLLTANSIPFTRADDSLRCELTVANTTYGAVYLVPAEGVFTDAYDRSALSDRMCNIQDGLFTDEFNARPRKDLYLVVVGAADFLARPPCVHGACDIEQDTSYAKKEVMTPEQVVNWLRGPFWHLSGNLRANAKPMFATVAHHRNEVPPKPNYLFDFEGILENCEEPHHVIRELTDSAYRRVMGSRRKVVWAGEYPELGWDKDVEGTPVAFSSSGERIAFAVALFLARAMMDMRPGMCLGFNASFDRLDTVRQIGAYDCLREFVVATGANVVVYSSKSSLRDLLQHRVGKVIAAIGGTATDHPESFF